MVWRTYPPPPVIYLPAPGQPMPDSLPPLPAPWGDSPAAALPHTRQLPTLEDALKSGKVPNTDQLKAMPTLEVPTPPLPVTTERGAGGEVSVEPPKPETPTPPLPVTTERGAGGEVSVAPPKPETPTPPLPVTTTGGEVSPAAPPKPEVPTPPLPVTTERGAGGEVSAKMPDTHELPLLAQAVQQTQGAPIRTDELEKLKGSPPPPPPGGAPVTHQLPPKESLRATEMPPASIEDTSVEVKRATAQVEAVSVDEPEKPGDLFRTFIVQQNYALRRMLAVDSPTSPGTRIPPTRVTLRFRGVPERFLISEDQVVILGRSDFRSGGLQVDVDLSRYGGHERGVSRAHARLHVRDKRLYLTDLYSANGTYLNGQRLEPEQPYLLQNGAEFLLGALSAKIEWE